VGIAGVDLLLFFALFLLPCGWLHLEYSDCSVSIGKVVEKSTYDSSSFIRTHTKLMCYVAFFLAQKILQSDFNLTGSAQILRPKQREQSRKRTRTLPNHSRLTPHSHHRRFKPCLKTVPKPNPKGLTRRMRFDLI
jgi:hypothetical protein